MHCIESSGCCFCGCVLVGHANVTDPNQEEELLENWIKELEQGIKDMSEVVGMPAAEETKPSTVSFWRHSSSWGQCFLLWRPFT